MIERVSHWIYTNTYKIVEYLGAVFSYLLYQAGIPLEIHAMNLNPYVLSFFHGILSMLVPVCSFYLIHVFKELLKDKDSWVSKKSDRVVFIISFKWIKK